MKHSIQNPFFSNPSVRDLYWALQGSGILSSHELNEEQIVPDAWFENELTLRMPLLLELDQNPDLLKTYLAEKTATTDRLGRYFEGLVSFWIEHMIKPHRFATNLIISGSREPGMKTYTLGELDFVFQKSAGEVAEHWEAAVKFYVFAGRTHAEALDPRNFVGTMVRDRLDLKIEKMFQHQLRITERIETLTALRKLGIESSTSRAIVKGALFFPLFPSLIPAGSLQTGWRTHPSPQVVSLNHQRGWWCSSDQSSRLHEQLSTDSVFIILGKARWLSPGRITPSIKPMSLENLRQVLDRHFAEKSSPLMIAELDPDQAGEMEVSRGLILDPGWLSRARGELGIVT